MPKPLISVLIDTYNHERFIEQAIVSVLEQDFSSAETEILVVDDGSTDRTPEIVRKFEPRIHSIRKPNGGQVSAFNAGIAKARGEIIAFLDGDDWWADAKMSQVVAAFEKNQQIAAVGHGYFEVDELGSIRAKWTPEPGSCLTLESPDLVLQSRNSRTFLGTSRLAIRKSVVARALPVPPELPFFDNFISSQAIAMGGASLLSEPLCYYRVHSGSLYAANATTQRQLQTQYQLLCGLLKKLPPRLKNLGASDANISAFLAFDRMDAARLKLKLTGGWPWETFRAESMSFRLNYRNPDWAYRVFKNLVLLSTLLMPPRSFYRLREWYAKRDLRRLREKLGSASLTAPDVAVAKEPAHKGAER